MKGTIQEKYEVEWYDKTYADVCRLLKSFAALTFVTNGVQIVQGNMYKQNLVIMDFTYHAIFCKET